MTKPSAWRAFLRPAGHRLPETSCAGRAPHGLSQPPDMGARHTAPLYGISLPCQGIPQPEYPGPRFRPASLSPPLRAYHEAASVGQPHESLRHRCPGIPKHAFTSRHPHKTFLRTESVPPCGVPAAIIKELPRRIRLFIAGRPHPILPEVFQRPGSKREREKTPASSLPSFPPPSPRPHDQTCPFLPAGSQRRGPAARPEESFFGDGESTRGEGAVFTKNAPSPLAIPLLHGISPTKKAGQSPAPAFTGKTKERG